MHPNVYNVYVYLQKTLSIILISKSVGCKDRFESSDVFFRSGREFLTILSVICLRVKYVTVPIGANYEMSDLPWQGEGRQDLVCLCRTEKVELTLVFRYLGFAHLFFLQPLDIGCLILFLQGVNLSQVKIGVGSWRGSYLHEVLYCFVLWPRPCSNTPIAFSFPSQYGSALFLSLINTHMKMNVWLYFMHIFTDDFLSQV